MKEIEWGLVVKQAQAGDKEAFLQLYENVYKDLYKYALYTLQNPQDAEDVISETVIDAFVEIGSLRQPSAFRGWIFRICSNKCKKKMKTYIQQRQNLTYMDGEEDFVERTQLCKEPIEQLHQKYEMQQALAQLEEEERMVITLTAVSGYTTKEVASHLQKNHSTIRSKYKRGLEKLRRLCSI